ncbi:MAG: Cytochrome-c oxidase [Pseudomonadota bacterium]|jgi:cytochrome c oxidase subunit III
MASHSQKSSHYFVPSSASYSVMLSAGVLSLLSGFVFNMNNFAAGKWMMIFGISVVLAMIFKWMANVVNESEGGMYSKWEDKSFRMGMISFIASEVAFFAAFFGALFFIRIIALPELASIDPEFTMYKGFTGAWPSAGPGGVVLGKTYEAAKFTPMGAWGLPAINTFLLLTSGVTVTWAHWGLLKNNRRQLIIGLFLTVLLGIAFLICQAMEYHHAYTEMGLTLGAGAYGATFFMLTGFHGFHVMLGTLMLIVILLRSMKGHFTAANHFGFEGVAWYWHFVDVVWLGLFVFVYWL